MSIAEFIYLSAHFQPTRHEMYLKSRVTICHMETISSFQNLHANLRRCNRFARRQNTDANFAQFVYAPAFERLDEMHKAHFPHSLRLI